MNESKLDTTDDQNIFTEWKIEMSRKFIRRSIFGSKEIDFVFKQVVVNNDKTSVSIAKVFALVQATTAYFKLLWSSGKGQARIGKGWPLRRKALKAWTLA